MPVAIDDCTGPLQRIASLAAIHEASVVDLRGDTLTLALQLHRADGRIVAYELQVKAFGNRISVKEEGTDHLPTFCPERHIVEGGNFCINWQQVDPLEIVDIDQASRWWSILLSFLWRQERAAKSRKWPGKAWAHGAAAKHQLQAEEAAARLGATFEQALEAGKLRVVRSQQAGGAKFIRVMFGHRRLYSVWESEERVATQRQRCVCGNSTLPIISCGGHARDAAVLAISLIRWPKAEAEFWEHNKGRSCCKTMSSCPLAESRRNAIASGEMSYPPRAA